MLLTQGIPSARSSSFPVDPLTGAVIVTPYVWDSINLIFVPQAVLPALNIDGGQLVHLLNAADISDRVARLLGHVNVDNFPASFLIGGSVEVMNDAGNPLPVSGTFWQTTQPVSIAGTVATQPAKSSTGVLSSVAATVTVDTTILASNANRLGGTVFNDSISETLYLAFATGASSTAYSVAVLPKGYVEIPALYTGRVSGVWTAAIGSARVTELT